MNSQLAAGHPMSSFPSSSIPGSTSTRVLLQMMKLTEDLSDQSLVIFSLYMELKVSENERNSAHFVEMLG